VNANQLPSSPASEHREQGRRQLLVIDWQVVARPSLVGDSGRVLGIVGVVGFYGTLRVAGPVMILAPILGGLGLTLATVLHVIPSRWATN
jgi:hypothetical protein